MSSESEVRGEVSLMEGGGALPRKSGDLVFHDNWERRAFAIAIALYEKGYYDWDDFRRILHGFASRNLKEKHIFSIIQF